MIHVTVPSTANGEPIPLVKYSQGREPEIPNPHAMHGAVNVSSNGTIDGMVCVGALPPATSPLSAVEVPLVSERGFKAGVLAACIGGVFLGALYFGCGPLICGCVASGCVGFVCGMLLTQEWK
jgi:hypothetical protein